MRKLKLIAASGWTLLILISCLASAKSVSKLNVSFLGYDKVIHATIYFILTLLWLFYIVTIYQPTKKLYLRVALSAFSYGIFIEILQGTLTSDRSADIFDVIANTIGIAIAIAVFTVYKKPKAI